MTLTVQTNQSAGAALQNIKQTVRDLEQTQDRISSGRVVNESADDPTRFAVANELRGDIEIYDAVQVGLTRGVSIGDRAGAAASAVEDLLTEMQAKALAATEQSLDGASRQTLNDEFTSLVNRITTVVNEAGFDNVNILDGSVTTGVEFLANAEASSTILLRSQDFRFNGPILAFDPATTDLNSVANAQAALADVRASFDNVLTANGQLGSDTKQLENHANFVSRLQDSLEQGVGSLVDADLAVEAARLEALQVQQQLGVQSLSIANGRPDVILSLFQS